METLRRMRSLMLVATLALAGCGDDGDEQRSTARQQQPEAQPERTVREITTGVFEALPAVDVPREKMVLGRRLYHDPQLSGDGSISCATCHALTHGGAEPRAVSTGIRGQQGPINSPTVLNAAFNFRQFWDGRAADLLEQAAGPITNPIEMGGDWPTILERLREDEEYVQQFQAIYGEEGITQENVLDAIVAYESFLVTPSDFDRWLAGQDDALNEQQLRGLRSFVEIGCTTCHRGRNLGGSLFQKLGLVHDYFERRGGAVTQADLGRFNVTGKEEDRHKFKVPTLRNVAETPPYFHDGSEQELAGAVRTMAYVQLGEALTEAQVADIVAFLESLTGEIPADALLPSPAGAGTPGVEAQGAERGHGRTQGAETAGAERAGAANSETAESAGSVESPANPAE